MLTPDDVVKIWGYHSGNMDAAPGDQPDVHQTLLTTRDAVGNLQAAFAAYQDATNSALADLAAAVTAIRAKVGA